MIIFFFGRETPLFWTRKRTLHNNITKLYGKSYLSLHAFYDHSIITSYDNDKLTNTHIYFF